MFVYILYKCILSLMEIENINFIMSKFISRLTVVSSTAK